MKYSEKPSAKWIIAGMALSNLAVFLLVLSDLLHLAGMASHCLLELSDYGQFTVIVLFITVEFVCYLLPRYYTDDDNAPLFPDQNRWQRRSLIGGWGSILVYAVLLIFLVKLQPEHFFLMHADLIPLVFSGSFLVDICRSLLLMRRLHREAEESVFKG